MSFTFTDYYCFERTCTIAKTRLDCVASTKSYPVFEQKRSSRHTAASVRTCEVVVGGLIARFMPPRYVKAKNARQASFAIAMGADHISSIYEPSPNAGAGYGNVNGKADALLFILYNFNTVNGAPQPGAKLEIFVARGMARSDLSIFLAYMDGELDGELEELRKRATPDPVPGKPGQE